MGSRSGGIGALVARAGITGRTGLPLGEEHMRGYRGRHFMVSTSSCSDPKAVNPETEVRPMGKGNNSQSKEKKKPKKGAKPAPVKSAPPPKK